jgi:hypothetical protein
MASARAQRADLAERHPSHAQRRRQAWDATLLVISMHPSLNYLFLEELYGAPDACISDRAGGGVSEGPAHGRVLLCTDDGAGSVTAKVPHEGVREVFQARFGGRPVCPRPRSLDRVSPDAIRDAAVDFFLLPGTQMFVESRGSPFSTGDTEHRRRLTADGPA